MRKIELMQLSEFVAAEWTRQLMVMGYKKSDAIAEVRCLDLLFAPDRARYCLELGLSNPFDAAGDHAAGINDRRFTQTWKSVRTIAREEAEKRDRDAAKEAARVAKEMRKAARRRKPGEALRARIAGDVKVAAARRECVAA